MCSHRSHIIKAPLCPVLVVLAGQSAEGVPVLAISGTGDWHGGRVPGQREGGGGHLYGAVQHGTVGFAMLA